MTEQCARRYDLEDRLIAFAGVIIDVVEALPNSRVGSHVALQLIRCGTSPAANYGEAQSAESRNDFIHRMRISMKELRETRVWLKIVVKKIPVVPNILATSLLAECEELIRIFAKSVSTARAGKDHT